MALFKIFGNFASGNTTLPTSTTQGYCYFDKNTGKFYIDTATSETAELETNRLALNANKADKDGAGNSITDTYLTKANGLTDVSLNTSTRKLQKTINGITSDITTLVFTPGAGDYSAVGGNDTVANGNYSLAFGNSASATADLAVAFGSANATGQSSLAGGIQWAQKNYPSIASGNYAISWGLSSVAAGNSSVAFGQGTTASSSYSVAMGNQSIANGGASLAIGQYAQADGHMSVALGNNTIAAGRAAMAIGQYNIEDTSSTATYSNYGSGARKYLFTIGNGTADNARSNALTVDWSGNTTIAGSLATSNIYLSGVTNISNNGIDVDPAFIGWNDNYLKLRFNDEESNSIELGNNGLIINDGTGVGNNGQALLSDGTKAYWGNISTEDTKVNVSTRGTTKAYLLADTTAPTSTAAAHTAVAESDVYLDTTAGALAATTYKIAEAVTLQYNSTTQALDFIFA